MNVPSGDFAKCTTEAGPMPDVLIALWQKIWQSEQLGKQRRYSTDYEVYGEASATST